MIDFFSQFTFFWADALLWSFFLILFLWLLIAKPQTQRTQKWYKLLQSNIAMISFVVLCFYLAIALLDSIHIKSTLVTNNQSLTANLSVLDKLLPNNFIKNERTYSAPFATHEWESSFVLDAGKNLVYKPIALKNIDTSVNLKWQSFIAVITSLIISIVLISLHLWFLAVKNKTKIKFTIIKVFTNKCQIKWRTAYLSLSILIMFMGWLYQISNSIHPFGTNQVGSDVLYESLKSIRTGVLIGVLTTVLMLPVAIILGISAGLFKGWVDDIVQYVYTTLNAIPGVLLIAAAVLVMQIILIQHPDSFNSSAERADLRLIFLILILGMTSWTGLCRLLRAETLKLSQIEFVTSAKALGVGKLSLMFRHILPNVMHIVLIAVVLDFSGLVLVEAVLSYVGVGVDPTMHSWGNMINQSRLEMAKTPIIWWPLTSAFVFMFVLVLSANLFADQVQVVLNPKS